MVSSPVSHCAIDWCKGRQLTHYPKLTTLHDCFITAIVQLPAPQTKVQQPVEIMACQCGKINLKIAPINNVILPMEHISTLRQLFLTGSLS